MCHGWALSGALYLGPQGRFADLPHGAGREMLAPQK